MDRLKKIVFATDFSDASQNALDHALLIAAKNDIPLHVLHVKVLHDDALGVYEEEIEKIAKEGFERLETRDVKIKPATTREVFAAPGIVNYATEQKADLIVIGTHGRTGLKHLVMGSVAQEVVRTSPISVLTVGTTDKHKPDGGLYTTVIAPVDYSEPSQAAFHEAALIAKGYGAKLVPVHVISDVPHPAYYVAAGSNILDVFPRLEEHARKALDELIAKEDLKGVEVESIIAEGRVHQKINELAHELQGSIIVMATAGLSGIDRLLLGSVAEKVLRTAPCPVLAVKGEHTVNV